MKKIILYGPFALVVLMFLGFNKQATEYHWKYIIEKIIFLVFFISFIHIMHKLTNKK